MTVVTVDLRDSRGVALSGYIQIQLDYGLANLTTEFTTAFSRVNLVAGLATLTLEPSELANVSYWFQVVQVFAPVAPATVGTEKLIRSFHAVVPDSLTPIAWVSLLPTGITRDALDTSFSAISRRLYNENAFWDTLVQKISQPRGAWVSTATYQRGDEVLYQGSTYLYVGALAAIGSLPTDTTRWVLRASVGATGAGTTGDNSAYNASGWLGSLTAPSKNAVRNVVETLATKTALTGLLTNSNLVSPIRADADPAISDNTSKIPSTGWVQAVCDVIRKALVPVGAGIQYGGSSAPPGFILANGGGFNTTTYALLFALIGYTFGGSGSTFNAPTWGARWYIRTGL